MHGCVGQLANHDAAVAPIAGDAVKEKGLDSLTSATGFGVVDGWIKNFNDPVLDALVSEALAANSGSKMAEVPFDQANDLIRQAESDLKPIVAFGAKYRDKNYTSRRLGTSAGFTKQSLAATVANGWFMAMTAKFQSHLAGEIVTLQAKGLDVADAMQIINKGTERDVYEARVALASAQETARYADSAYENALKSLEFLLGRYPSSDIEAVHSFLAVPPQIPAEISSVIMERRSDIIAAERHVAEAFYKQKELKILRLPPFQLSLASGENTLSDAIAGLTAGVFTPLYAGSVIEDNVATATAKQKEAIAAYAQVVLKAFKEVKTALVVENHLLQYEIFLKIEVESNRKTYEETNLLYEIEQISMLDVLIIQNKWIASRIIEFDMAGKRLVNRVTLHLALGGSFEE